MSSLRRTQSSKANGALSKGPVTPEGKLHSSQNAIIHGLLADCIVLEDESRENFLALLQQHVDRFQPANEVEFGMIEEMCAARWRQRRAWAIETRLFETQIARPLDGDSLDRMADAIDFMAAAPSLSLVHRYETRLHIMYRRALNNLITLRKVKAPNEPSPISEHSPDAIPPGNPVAEQPPSPQPASDSEALGSAHRQPTRPPASTAAHSPVPSLRPDRAPQRRRPQPIPPRVTLCTTARRDDFVGQVGNLRPIVNRPSGITYKCRRHLRLAALWAGASACQPPRARPASAAGDTAAAGAKWRRFMR